MKNENYYDIFLRLFDYNPNTRITIEELIQSNIFDKLKLKLDYQKDYEIKQYFI